MDLDLKIRKLISELLEPSLSKMQATEVLQSKLSKYQKFLKEKVQVLNTKFETLEQKFPFIDPIHKRIAEHSAKITAVEVDTKGQYEYMNNTVESISSRFGFIISQLNSLNNQKDSLREDLNLSTKLFLEFKNTIEERLELTKNELKAPFLSQAETNILQQAEIKQIGMHLENLGKEVGALEYISKKNERNLTRTVSEFKTQCERLENNNQKTVNDMDKFKEKYFYFEKQLMENFEFVRSQAEKKILKICEENEKKVFQILEFVLAEPRHKKKIVEFQKIQENELVFKNQIVNNHKKLNIQRTENLFVNNVNSTLDLDTKENHVDTRKSLTIQENFEKPVETSDFIELKDKQSDYLLENSFKANNFEDTKIKASQLSEEIINLTDFTYVKKSAEVKLIENSQKTEENNSSKYYENLIEELQDQQLKQSQEIIKITENLKNFESSTKLEFSQQKDYNGTLEKLLETSLKNFDFYIEDQLKP